MNSLELKDAINKYITECRSIVETCKSEMRLMSEDEKSRYDELKQLITSKKDELQKLEEELNSYDVPEIGNEEENTEKHERNKMNKTKFSLLKAIRSVVNNQNLDNVSQSVINAGADEFRKAGVSYAGQIQLPTLEERAAITVADEGENVVVTDIFDIMEPLRAKNVLVEAGAKFMTGLVGNVQIPIMSASNVTWEGETSPAKDGAGTFSNVTLSPKRLTAYIDISKQFINQDSIGAEGVIRQDLINAINNKLEATILGSEAGTATQPAGMFNAQTPTATTTFDKVTALEATVEAANVIGECKYILSPTAKAAFRNMQKGTSGGPMVLEGGEIDGTKALSTSHVAANNYVYGDFSNLAIGSWGAIDLTVDPYTKAADGMIRIVINAFFDAKVLRSVAFAYGKTVAG